MLLRRVVFRRIGRRAWRIDTMPNGESVTHIAPHELPDHTVMVFAQRDGRGLRVLCGDRARVAWAELEAARAARGDRPIA